MNDKPTFDMAKAREEVKKDSGLYISAHQVRICANLLEAACSRIEELEKQNKNLKEHWPGDLYGVRIFANADVACKAALEHIDQLKARIEKFEITLKRISNDETRCCGCGGGSHFMRWADWALAEDPS